jgi:hypothetical protein
MASSGTARGGATGSRPYLLVAMGLIGGGLLLAILIVLVMTLGEIRSTEKHVGQTDAKLERAFSLAAPAAEDAQPLLEDADTALAQALPAVRDASAFLEPLADDGADASVFLDRLPLLQQRASGFVDEAALAVQLASTFLTDALSQDVVSKASTFLDDALNQDLVSKVSDSHRILAEVLEVQRKTLRTQRRSLRVQVQTSRKLSRSLDLQRGALKHTRSIDRKTGGELPPG